MHLYFGKFKNASTKAERAKYVRRVLEIYALARWADLRSDKASTYDRDITVGVDRRLIAGIEKAVIGNIFGRLIGQFPIAQENVRTTNL